MGDKKKRKKETQSSDSHENEIAVLSIIKKMKKKKLKQNEDDASDLAGMQNGEISDKNKKKLKKRNKSKEKLDIPEEATLQGERTDDVAHRSDRTSEEPNAMPTQPSSISQDINDSIEKEKKKKRKREGKGKGINDKNDHNMEEIKDETICVKVKKKSKVEHFESVESIHSSQLGEDKGKNNSSKSSAASEVSNEHLETQKKKKEKRKTEEKEGIYGNDKKDYIIEDIEDETVSIKKKKKKKKSKDKDEPLVSGKSIQFLHTGGEVKLKDNFPKSFASFEVSNEHLETKEKKKKKTKHKKQSESCSQLNISMVNGNKELQEEDELESKPEKKKLKRKRQHGERGEDKSIPDKEQEEDFKKKKTKKKVDKDKDDNSIHDENHVTVTFKSDLLKDEGSENFKKKQFSQLSGKSTMKADSMDTAKEKESSVQTVAKGQWEGEMFGSDERQSKFLRLLGGMKAQNNDRKKLFSSGNSSQKKGLFGSLSASVPSSSSHAGNKALSVSEAVAMDKRLEEDYNRAMNFRLKGKKSAGLGFTPDPAEGKKFHIDANASKSLKFDDD